MIHVYILALESHRGGSGLYQRERESRKSQLRQHRRYQKFRRAPRFRNVCAASAGDAPRDWSQLPSFSVWLLLTLCQSAHSIVHLLQLLQRNCTQLESAKLPTRTSKLVRDMSDYGGDDDGGYDGGFEYVAAFVPYPTYVPCHFMFEQLHMAMS